MTDRAERPDRWPRRFGVGAVCGAIIFTLLAPVTAGAGNGTISGKVTYKKKKYLVNTVVYVDSAPGKFPPPKAPVKMGQQGNQFTEKVLVVLKGSTVEYANSDPTEHNVNSPDGEKFDLGKWGEGESRTYTYENIGTYTQLCKLHPMMLAYVVVLQNPYHAITDTDGNFTIKNVPAGKYTLKVWNERRKSDPLEIEVKAGAEAAAAIALKR